MILLLALAPLSASALSLDASHLIAGPEILDHVLGGPSSTDVHRLCRVRNRSVSTGPTVNDGVFCRIKRPE